MSEKLKKLTGKNPKDFEPEAFKLINNVDTDLFKELVDSEDFLFDFVKQNVAKRLEKNCTPKNYRNLLQFFKYYSPSYEEFIIRTLTKYANEDLTDEILNIFDSGTDEEKTYCAKYFSIIQDPLSIDYLKNNVYSPNAYLSSNCIEALANFGHRDIYNEAICKLNSKDEFEQFEGVKFLVTYGDKNAVKEIIKTIKISSMAENMACELPYLINLEELLNINNSDGLYVLNLIISGLGETCSLSQIFDFEIYEIIDKIIQSQINSQEAVVLLNAKDKFETLTENDEYLFDETKEVKQEILDIKSLLYSLDTKQLTEKSDNEINIESPFVYYALDFTKDTSRVRQLLNSYNQTLILKSIEILKKLNNLTNEDKKLALNNISDDNIRNIINAI